MNCSKEDLEMKKETICNHHRTECGSKSSVEGGYISCDELDDDCEKIDGSENVRSTSQGSNDAGYISSPDEENIPMNQGNFDTVLKSPNIENSPHEIIAGLLNEPFYNPESLQSLTYGLSVGLPKTSKVPIHERPEWLDLDKFKAGQKFAIDHLIGLNHSMLLSLLILFSFPEGLEPLVFTNKSSTPYTSYKRYLSTILRVKSWFENDLWSEGNVGYQNLKTVRAMHLNVSKKMNNASRQEIRDNLTLEGSKRHPSLWCPLNSKLKEYFSSACPATVASTVLGKNYYYTNKKLFLNQSEMSVTQFAFFGLMIMYPEHFGAGGATREDLDNFVHCWRGIGYLLGVKDEYNFCRGTFDEVKQRCHDLVNEVVKPNFSNLSKDWEHMSRCVVEGITFYIPTINFEVCLAYLCWVIGIDAPQFYSSLTWKQYFLLNHMKFFFRFTLRIPRVLSLCNERIISLLNKQKYVSAEKLELFKNKKYSYQKEVTRP